MGMVGRAAVAALRAERLAFVETLSSLDDATFAHGETLCAGWSPRDVLVHVMGVESNVGTYLRAGGNVNRANARIVAAGAGVPREELLERARGWAASPRPLARATAGFLLGDLVVHHQDVLFPLGRDRPLPDASRRALLREGTLLGARRLLRHRLVPTDGGRPRGRGPVLTGTGEAVGMWLAGRDAYRARLSPPPEEA